MGDSIQHLPFVVLFVPSKHRVGDPPLDLLVCKNTSLEGILVSIFISSSLFRLRDIQYCYCHCNKPTNNNNFYYCFSSVIIHSYPPALFYVPLTTQISQTLDCEGYLLCYLHHIVSVHLRHNPIVLQVSLIVPLPSLIQLSINFLFPLP